ncbi:hypothetical protein HQ531_04195 [bacterium]|nr:hypothetical protein [bacterium]
MDTMYLEMIELFFIIGGCISFVMGAILYFKPEVIAKLSKTGNTWFSSRKSTKPLDIIHDTDSFYFTNNIAVGSVMIVLSIIALYLTVTRVPTAVEYMVFASSFESGIRIGVLLETIRYVLLITITIGLPVWVLLAINPEKLKAIASSLNRWISTRLLLLPLERMNNGFDVFVLQNHRIFGALFVAGAGFILFKFLV